MNVPTVLSCGCGKRVVTVFTLMLGWLSSSQALAAGDLYWTSPTAIWTGSTQGSEPQPLVPTLAARDLDVGASQIVWTEVHPRVPIFPTGQLRSASLTGADPVTLRDMLPSPEGIVLDPGQDVLYWTDLEQHVIQRWFLLGAVEPEKILAEHQEIVAIHDLVLDRAAGKLYFGYVNPLIDSLFPGAIARMNLDGGDLEIVASGLLEPRGLALAPETQQLFVTDGDLKGSGLIKRIDLVTREVSELITDLDQPRGIVVDEADDTLYWTEQGSGLIRRSDLNGGQVGVLYSQLDMPGSLALRVVPEPSAHVLWLTASGWLAARARRRIAMARTQIAI